MNQQPICATAKALAYQPYDDVTRAWPDSVRHALCDTDTAEALAIVADEEGLTDAEKDLIERIERVSMECCAARMYRADVRSAS